MNSLYRRAILVGGGCSIGSLKYFSLQWMLVNSFLENIEIFPVPSSQSSKALLYPSLSAERYKESHTTSCKGLYRVLLADPICLYRAFFGVSVQAGQVFNISWTSFSKSGQKWFSLIYWSFDLYWSEIHTNCGGSKPQLMPLFGGDTTSRHLEFDIFCIVFCLLWQTP